MSIRIVFIILFQFFIFNAFSQEDTTNLVKTEVDSVYDISNDTISIENDNFVTDSINKKNPKLAAWLSVFVPGLGQAYNEKYWKIPVFYTVFGTFIYQQQLNSKRYRRYLNALIALTDDDESTVSEFPSYSEKELEFNRKKFRRNRDLYLLLTIATWLLNWVDASVDAHLYDFDISDDLTIKLRPTILQTHTYKNVYGISLSIKF